MNARPLWTPAMGVSFADTFATDAAALLAIARSAPAVEHRVDSMPNRPIRLDAGEICYRIPRG